jgi:hypothetical protein
LWRSPGVVFGPATIMRLSYEHFSQVLRGLLKSVDPYFPERCFVVRCRPKPEWE